MNPGVVCPRTLRMNFELVLFIILGALGMGSAIGVIAVRNPISAAMSLVIHFIALSGLYLTLNAMFIAAIQVLVYAGAIMVLVVFVIMLLNLGSEEKLRERFTSRQGIGIALSVLLGAGLVFIITRAAFRSPGADGLPPGGSVEAVGTALFRDYVYPFEMVSLILLAAVVGAVVLAKRHVE